MVNDIWAIAWPILKAIIEKMPPEDIFLAILIYIAIVSISRGFLKKIFPIKTKGNPFSEAWGLIVDVITLVGPLAGSYYFLVEKFPQLEEVVEFILDTEGIEETVIVWGKILLVTSVAFGLARWLIYRISVLFQRQFEGHIIPLTLIRVAEGLGFTLTVMWVPFFAFSLLLSGEEINVATGDPLAKPPNVIEEVWTHVESGVSKARNNGTDCSPYLIYSLKLYETSVNICTELNEDNPRPNKCASYAGAVGMMQFLPETFERNAKRHGIDGSPWNPTDAVEVACYFIAEEVKISLDQSEEEFVQEFSSKGLIWNADPIGAALVYNRALKFRRWAQEEIQDPENPNPEPEPAPKPKPEPEPEPNPPPKVDGYLWPAPKKSFVTFAWGAQMSYGVHNGIDIVLSGFPPFKVVALADGKARYWDGGGCNAGVIDLRLKNGETFQYVHMSWKGSEIYIPTNGTWVSVKQGETLGWIHNGTTSCSDGPHLHLMRMSGAWIGVKEFIRP